jgi:hypothetical protein
MNRAALALMVAVTLSAGIAAATQAQAPSALPDLDEQTPDLIEAIQQSDGSSALAFDTTVVNVGDAEFRLEGQRGAGEWMAAEQVVGGRRVPAGEMVYVRDQTHQHWHIKPFQRYELRRDGRLVSRDVKQGFCLSDIHIGTAMSNDWCGFQDPGRSKLTMGLRARGGTDTYYGGIEGQQIPISRDIAPSGRYTLVVRIDPSTPFVEADTSNNVSSVALDLRWPSGNGLPTVSVIQECLHSSTCPPAPEPEPNPAPAPQPPAQPGPVTAPPVETLSPNTAPSALRMTLAKSYRYGRLAVRREFESARTRTSKLRISRCRADVRERVRCVVTWRSRTTSWRGHIWLAAFDAPPRWGYRMRLTGRLRNCTAAERKCSRRLVRRWKMGGPFPRPGSA